MPGPRTGGTNFWVTRRAGRGGGWLYAISSLPAAARAAIEARRTQRVPANLRSVGRPKGSDFFTKHPEVADAVEAIITQRDLSDPAILDLLSRQFPVLPSRRTLQRFRAALEEQNKALIASMRDPDLFKGRYKVALGRADGGITRANQRWEIDTTKADVMTRGGRVCILGLIDVYRSRRRGAGSVKAAPMSGFTAPVIRPKALHDSDLFGIGVTAAVDFDDTPRVGITVRHRDGEMLSALLDHAMVHRLIGLLETCLDGAQPFVGAQSETVQ